MFRTLVYNLFLIHLALTRPELCVRFQRYRRYQEAERLKMLDLVTNIDPIETPMFSELPRVQSNAMMHQWMLDELRAREEAMRHGTGIVEVLYGDAFTYGATASSTPRGGKRRMYC